MAELAESADDSGATTRLALRAIARLVAPGMRVLDAGCGEGPLAEAAAARGGLVRAVDHDPLAVARARARGVPAELGQIEDVAGDYDLVLANLWSDELVRLAPALEARLAPGGALYATGARLWQAPTLPLAFRGLEVARVDALDGWCGFELHRRS